MSEEYFPSSILSYEIFLKTCCEAPGKLSPACQTDQVCIRCRCTCSLRQTVQISNGTPCITSEFNDNLDHLNPGKNLLLFQQFIQQKFQCQVSVLHLKNGVIHLRHRTTALDVKADIQVTVIFNFILHEEQYTHHLLEVFIPFY